MKKILYTGVAHSAPNYLTWLKLVRDKKVPLLIADKEQNINLGAQAKLEILYPDKSFLNKTVADLNQSSIVLKLIHGQNVFLLTGDAGLEVEKKLIDSGADLSAEVLKVGHHGSQYATSQEFLEKIKPRFAIIEAGEDNDYGHPNLRIIKRIERAGAEIYRTDEKGTIRMVSDGSTVIASD